MHVDWMVAMTPRAACHSLLQQNQDLVTALESESQVALTWVFKDVNSVTDGDSRSPFN